MKYILSGNIQSEPLEKRFGRYRQLSGANYFGTQKQFLEAEKVIRVKSTQKLKIIQKCSSICVRKKMPFIYLVLTGMLSIMLLDDLLHKA